MGPRAATPRLAAAAHATQQPTQGRAAHEPAHRAGTRANLRSSSTGSTHVGLQLVVCLADAGAVEGVGLDDIRAALQVRGVDLGNHVWPSDHEHIVVALELVAVLRVALAAEVLLLQLELLDLRAHGAVNEDDALPHERIKLLKGCGLGNRVRPCCVAGNRRELRGRR
jgi:hypothetical protein